MEINMIFKKKKIKEEDIPEFAFDAPTVLPEVSVADLSDEVNIVIDDAELGAAMPDFPVSDDTDSFAITEASIVKIDNIKSDDSEGDSALPFADEMWDISVTIPDAMSDSGDGADAEKVSAADTAETSCDDVPSEDVAELSDEDADGVCDGSTDVTDTEEGPTETDGENIEVAQEESSEDDGLSDFERSIRNFSAGDIDAAVENGEKKRDMVRVFVMVLCACVFLYSTSYLVRNIHDKIKSDRIYADIIDSVADGFGAEGTVVTGGKVDLLASDLKSAYTPTMDEIIKNGAGEVTSQSDHSAELSKMRASLESLRNINPDIYAWIKVPGTNINYPVAKTDNNEYYLDHAYTGDNLVNGSIYADYRCVLPITDNYNTVLYGHNVTSGSMFNHVTHFFKPEVFETTNIYVYTFDGIYVFKPFSIHEAAYDSGYVNMGFSGEEFVAFATNLAEMSDIKTDITFTPGDRLITLSTCTNGISTQRYALHGVLIETITE